MTNEKPKMPPEIQSDFLIIGSGLAGLYAALYASKFGSVTVLTKSTVEESNSFWAQGGIAAAIDPEDSAWFHLEDTLRAGRSLCNEKAVEVLVNEGIDRVSDLIKLGMEFDMGDKGPDLGLEGGHTKRRILHAGGTSTGREMVRFLISAVEKTPAITKYESTGVIELLSDGKSCYGALALDSGFEPVIYSADATVLASGGASALYERTTNPGGSTGEGISISYRAGASITDMEFVQFHPTAFYSEDGGSFLISEAVRGEGAHLLNLAGKRFMQDYSDLAELAPRDIVSKAIHKEMRDSGAGHVYLDLRHLDPHTIKSRFENIYLACKEYGFDMCTDMIPVAPAAHYTIGGVRTGLRGETNLKRLFACGEVACTGVHGANRLASNSLLECVVFAKRAIDAALEIESSQSTALPALKTGGILLHTNINQAEGQDLFMKCTKRAATILNRNVGIVRDSEGLSSAISQLEECSGYLDKLTGLHRIRLQMALDVSMLIARFSLLREESRGVHIRQDFPEEEPLWRSHIVLEYGQRPRVVPV